jgi:hypothetical protein
MATYDKRTGALLPEGSNPDYSGVQDPSILKFNDTTGQPITLDQLKTKETPIVTQSITPTVTPAPITLSGATSPEVEAEVAKIKAQKDTEVSGITGIMKELGIEQGKEAGYATEAGADIAQKKYTEFANQLTGEQRALEIAQRNLSNQGLTQEQVRTSSSALERQSLQKQADIAILGNAAKGDFDTAMAIAKRKVESAVAPLKAELEAKKFIFENNKELFSKAEIAKLDSLLKQEENKIAREEKTLDTIEQIKIEAAKNGMKSFTGFDKVKTVDEALNLAGSYLNTPQTEVVKLDNGSTVVVDKKTGKIINTLGGAKSTVDGMGNLSPEFSSIASRTAALVPSVTGQETIKNDLTRYLKAQDYFSAYNQIENTVEEGLTGTSKTIFQDAKTDGEILKNLKTKIQDFENAGGDTGLLTGSAESIKRKLLGVTGTPELTSLATELQREFQRYRVGMTGAAFSPKESRDYASVNPKTTSNFDLNMAVIDGAISQLDNRVNSTVDRKIKGAGDIRKLAEIPKQNAKENQSNVFQSVSQSMGQIYTPSTGWKIPGQSN